MDLVGTTARRTGSRGGRDQFSWSTVAAADAADRSHYLGASVKAPPRRRGDAADADPSWYTRPPPAPGTAAAAGPAGEGGKGGGDAPE